MVGISKQLGDSVDDGLGAIDKSKPIVVSDWEGPWVSADHAYDVVKVGIPNGDRLFSALSNYAVYLADVRKQRDAEPGETLRLAVPFLIAYGADDRLLNKIAIEDAKFIDGSKEAINLILCSGSSFWVVSTSYNQYVWQTAPMAGIPIEKTRCTILPIGDLSKYVREEDKEMLRGVAEKVSATAALRIDKFSKEDDMPTNVRDAVAMLDGVFSDTLPRTSFAPALETVKPVGGQRKLDSLVDIMRREGRKMADAVVLGDSITDRSMLGETSRSMGLAISFNGNEYAIKNANVAVASSNCMVTPVLVQIFGRAGLSRIEEIASNWSIEVLRREVGIGNLDRALFNTISGMVGSAQPKVYWITDDNKEKAIKQSLDTRNFVRGEVSKLT
ncbi:MAG: hypothetical protein ACREBW_08385 [Candidatus Micrarchaeaceae archaeon]